MSCRTICCAVSLGTAKPIPTLPSDVPPVSIWESTPMTRPSRLTSGPPELPWLMAASVWIAWSIESPFGAVIARPVALTIPAVIVRSSPNGFPIA
jgi:hypothetical protein